MADACDADAQVQEQVDLASQIEGLPEMSVRMLLQLLCGSAFVGICTTSKLPEKKKSLRNGQWVMLSGPDW